VRIATTRGADRHGPEAGRSLSTLPVDPGLSHYAPEVDWSGSPRFVVVDTARNGAGQVEATEAAGRPMTAGARLERGLLRAALGAPLKTTALAQERMR
jgi:hypothetical protein